MAKSPESVQDAVMDISRMKAILKLALVGDDDGSKVRLPIVVGLDNGDEAVVSVAKRGNPKGLRAEIIKTIQKEGLSAKMKPDASKLYYGYAYTSEDAEGVLQIDVNKQPAGADKLAAKVFKSIRSAGFSEVVFHVNESLENASEDDAPEAGVAAGSQAGPGAASLPPTPPTPATPAADLGALTRELTAAIGDIARVAGADPARKATLAQLAGAANAAVKAQNADEAARLIEGLKAAIAGGGDKGPSQATPAPAKVAPEKLLALFRDAKEEVDDGLNKLQAALRATGDEDLLRIAEYGLYGMTDGAGVGLMKALFDLQGAAPGPGDPLLAAASEAAKAYRDAVFADEAVDLVDNNPFGVTVGIKAKLGPALDMIASAA